MLTLAVASCLLHHPTSPSPSLLCPTVAGSSCHHQKLQLRGQHAGQSALAALPASPDLVWCWQSLMMSSVELQAGACGLDFEAGSSSECQQPGQSATQGCHREMRTGASTRCGDNSSLETLFSCWEVSISFQIPLGHLDYMV